MFSENTIKKQTISRLSEALSSEAICPKQGVSAENSQKIAKPSYKNRRKSSCKA